MFICRRPSPRGPAHAPAASRDPPDRRSLKGLQTNCEAGCPAGGGKSTDVITWFLRVITIARNAPAGPIRRAAGASGERSVDAPAGGHEAPDRLDRLVEH